MQAVPDRGGVLHAAAFHRARGRQRTVEVGRSAWLRLGWGLVAPMSATLALTSLIGRAAWQVRSLDSHGFEPLQIDVVQYWR